MIDKSKAMAIPELVFKLSQYHFSDQEGRTFVLIRERTKDSYTYSLNINGQLVCEKKHEELKCLKGMAVHTTGASWVLNAIQEMYNQASTAPNI